MGKKTTIGMIVCLVVLIVTIVSLDLEVDNNVSNIDGTEYYLCGMYYTETMEYINKNTLNLYNPPSKEVYEQAYTNITKLMTDACSKSYGSQLGEFKAVNNRIVTIDKIDVGFSDWQDDGNGRIFVRLLIQGGKDREYLNIEYKINSNNKIYTYEMW